MVVLASERGDIAEYDVVRLLRDCGAAKAGWVGTALLIHGTPLRACEVEFTDGQGKTLAVETVEFRDLDLVVRPNKSEEA